MSRILSIFIALTAVLAVLAAPIPNDNTFDLRGIPEEAFDLATREYINSLTDIERRSFWKKLGGIAKKAVGVAAQFNPYTRMAGTVARFIPGKVGRKVRSVTGAVGLTKRFEDEDEEVFLRDVEDELALRDEEFAEFDIRDLADEDVALATRDYIDSLDEFERRNIFNKFKTAVVNAGRKVRGITSSPVFNAAVSVAGQFGGRRGRALSRTASRVGNAASYFRRDFEESDELSFRDLDDELDLRDLSDEDLALAVRAAWEDLDENERRSLWSSIKSRVAKVKEYVAPARQILGAAGGIAGQFGGRRGKAFSRGVRTASRGLGSADRATSSLGFRDFEDDE